MSSKPELMPHGATSEKRETVISHNHANFLVVDIYSFVFANFSALY
jgi:hypothetical protein